MVLYISVQTAIAIVTVALFTALLLLIIQLSYVMARLGSAKTNFTYSSKSISLKQCDESDITLAQMCQDSTPPCKLNPLLFNGHLQTMWTAVKDEGPHVYYKRKIFESEGCSFPGTFAVDFVCHEPETEIDKTLPPRTTYYSKEALENIGLLDSQPMLVVLHGISGGSSEVYLKHVLAPLVEEDGVWRWEACVINSRGCAMHKITTEYPFNARSTWDIRQTILWLKKTFPNRPLFGIGFSLGANVLINYLGEEGDACPLKAAIVVSNPWTLEVCNAVMMTTALGRMYLRFMGKNIKEMFLFNYEVFSKNPKLDLQACKKIRYVHDFDEAVQAPTWGYPSAKAYFRDASCIDSLEAVRIPLFAINAENDPETLPYSEVKHNPYTVLCTTSNGGHLSWFEGIRRRRWFVRPVTNFLNKMAFEIGSSPATPQKVHSFEDENSMASHFRSMQRRWKE